MKEIKDIRIVQDHLLNIAIAVDKVLSAHNIPFIIAYGSLLGAVRHGGFIPWDDDMDFYIPTEKYEEAWECLSRELPFPYEVVSYKSHSGCQTNIYKVHDKSTILDDKGMYGMLEDKLGINIDLFPLILNIDGTDSKIKVLKRLQKIQQVVFKKDVLNRPCVNFLKKVLRTISPISENRMREMIISYSSKFRSGSDSYSYLANIWEKEIIPMKYFGNYSRVEFAGYFFLAPEDPDGYLKFYYGDYMQLPPEEKRHWHGNGVYYR